MTIVAQSAMDAVETFIGELRRHPRYAQFADGVAKDLRSLDIRGDGDARAVRVFDDVVAIAAHRELPLTRRLIEMNRCLDVLRSADAPTR